MTSPLHELFDKRRVIISAGTGGVGKTTMSAALAVTAALLGKRAVVITVDPAKRLVTSLGLQELGDDPKDITPLLKSALEKMKADGFISSAECPGTLAAVMPDIRKTFENFARRVAPTPETAEKVINNPVMKVLATDFSGANEYMALERLNTIEKLQEFDCIILDTPPNRNTLTLLNLPSLAARFFEERLIKWIVLPTNKLVSAGVKRVLSIMERLTGSGFLNHLFELTHALFEIQDTALELVKRMDALLHSQRVGFVIVTTPTPETVPELTHLIGSLKKHDFHFDGVVLNRTLSYFKLTEEERNSSLNTSDPGFSQGLELVKIQQDREKGVVDQILDGLLANDKNRIFWKQMPELSRDVHSIEDLVYIAHALLRT